MKKMYLKQIFIILISSGLVACASAGTEPTDADSARESRGSDCISEGTVRDYRVLDERNLIVSGAGRRKYHVVLSRRALGLRSSWSIGFVTRTGVICGGFSDVLVKDGSLQDNIRILSIRRLSPEDEEDLLIRFGKKEPDEEQTPAPEPVDSAEVEELD